MSDPFIDPDYQAPAADSADRDADDGDRAHPHAYKRRHNLLEGLTEPQAEAVTHVDGPLLVLAGPGSGKTRVITHRIAHLVLETGIAPWNVLAITFTNKAAGEMRSRVSELVSERQARALNVSTFHSLCARLLRVYGDRMELPPGYSIYDSADQQRAVKTAIEALDMNTSNFPASKVLHTISNAKNELIDAEGFNKHAFDFYSKNVAKIYARYEQILQQNNALDFDDLLLKTVTLLRDHEDVLKELRERFQYVQIDEYQDTNHVQFLLAHALAAEHKNLCVTGDPDQSIYGWRGANIRNILEFEQHYPNAKIVRLEQNYRSTGRILAVADELIKHNSQRRHKTLWTENELGESVRVVKLYDERKEADYILEQFQDLHVQRGVPWSGFAIFYRTNSLSRVVEEAFLRAGVPYQVARGTSFYERKEIKDAIAYLRAIANPRDEVNLLRIINTPPRRISDRTVKALQGHAVGKQCSVADVLHAPEEVRMLKKPACDAITRFRKLLAGLRDDAGLSNNDALIDVEDELSLRGFVEKVLRESGLEDHYRNDKSDPDGDRIENLGELVSSAQQYEDDLAAADSDPDDDNPIRIDAPHTLAEKLLGYLERVSLVSDADAINSAQGAVTLMTLHAAKGLEYPVVAMVGMEEGLLPHSRSVEEDNLEEERRLCFVGITRAQRMLFLTHAHQRSVFGQTNATIPSSFLRELPRDQIEEEDLSRSEWSYGDGSEVVSLQVVEQRAQASQQALEFPPGTLVRHRQFGLGRVLTVGAHGAQTRAKVQFNTSGVKTLILQYARLEKVEP